MRNVSEKKAIAWTRKTLGHQGFQLNAVEPEIIKDTPWSIVARFETHQGHVYLKQMPEAIALEPKIIHLLKAQFNVSVPDVLAQNEELHCFLMKDAGRPLREKLKQQFDQRLLCQAVQQFTTLQLEVAKHIDDFFELGVPDWRLHQLPGLYNKVIDDKNLLLEEGFSQQEIERLQSSKTKIKMWAHELLAYPMPETIIQPDFHDNNLLIDDGSNKITWIDLGEVLISHPFFPLFTYLMQIKKHHGLIESDPIYQKIKQVSFEPYRQLLGSDAVFEQAIAVAEKLNWVYGIAYQYTFMKICGKEALIKVNQWKLKAAVHHLMEIM